jgi:predicted metal-dependent peptidase
MSADEKVKNLVARYVLKYNYWGYLFSRVRRRGIPGYPSIMGVQAEPDGTITLAYNPELINGTDNEVITKVVEHEGMHLLNKHLSRCIRMIGNDLTTMHPLEAQSKINLFNVASDCCVNTQIGLKNPVIINGKEWPPCIPEKYELPENKTSEYYYIELMKKAKKIKIPPLCDGGFSDHKGWQVPQGVSDASSLSRKLDNHISSIIRESVKNFSRDRGTLPSHIARLIDEALQPPKAPYYQIIKKLVKGTRLSKFRRTPTRVNRKRTYVFNFGTLDGVPIISPFPGRTRDFSFFIDIVIDTSGSMSPEEIREALSGCKNIIDNDKHTKTRVLECDAKVHNTYTLRKVGDINFKPKGGGGTTLMPGLIESKKANPDVTLVFTDGGCENINAQPRKDMPKKIIWVVSGDPRQVNQTGFVVRI